MKFYPKSVLVPLVMNDSIGNFCKLKLDRLRLIFFKSKINRLLLDGPNELIKL